MLQSLKNFIDTSKILLTQKSFSNILLNPELLKNPDYNHFESVLFTRLQMSNGTAKMTFANRMPEVDDYVKDYLKGLSEPILLQDVGISSGISTYELFQKLNQTGKNFKLTGGDAFIEAKFASLLNRNLNILCEPNGHLLEIDFFGLVCSSAQKKYGYIWYFFFFPIFDLIFKLYGKKLVQKPKFKTFNLVSQHLSDHVNINIITDDILNKEGQSIEKYDIIRAANIINLAYFKESEIKQIVLNLKKRLKPNGILIINRTNYENLNNGHVYQLLTNDSFKIIHQFGTGSEVNHLIEVINE